VTDALGPIDVLVNNAGGLIRRASLADCDDDYVDDMLALNARQLVAFVRSVVPGMREYGGGSILNVGSSAARHGGGSGTAVYAATKGFVASLTRALAKELAGDGIRVNAVSPGVILTSFHDRHTPASALEVSRATIPLKRLGRADECAGAMLFLASDAMSSFVTGQVLEVNGGQVMP
jgi:3-oxoacyl-[acyl-carrier protein] reductase